jgi:hypothetical protein
MKALPETQLDAAEHGGDDLGAVQGRTVLEDVGNEAEDDEEEEL